jgi:hypothetical protein
MLPLIVAGGMQPSRCRMCHGQAPLVEHDCGWFGDHSKGVDVSKGARRHLLYCLPERPQTVRGRRGRRGQPLRAAPRRRTAHESPENLEFFVWDDATQAEPPRCACRAVPRALCHPLARRQGARGHRARRCTAPVISLGPCCARSACLRETAWRRGRAQHAWHAQRAEGGGTGELRSGVGVGTEARARARVGHHVEASARS